MFNKNSVTANGIKLRVAELTGREEFGRGIARIDYTTMKQLGIKEGEVIEIEGKKKTGVIAIRAYPADVGLNIIRIDGLVRKNCDATIGETIMARKSDVKEAKKVVLAPAQKGVIFHISPNLLRQNLRIRPVAKGDIIIANPVFKMRDRTDDIFSRMFGIDLEEVFMPMAGEMRLVVTKTSPEGIAQITEFTEVELLTEAVDVEEKKLPEVNYEDIGGLNEVLPKIREMIELPLRRPELFEKLGIEPPKGILLFGSPGTGKCIGVDQPVLINNRVLTGSNLLEGSKTFRNVSDGKIAVDNAFVIYNDMGRPKPALLYSEDYGGRGYKITTKTGRSVAITPDHKLLTVKEDGIEWREAKNLEKGDRIALPFRIDFNEHSEVTHPSTFMEKMEGGPISWKDSGDFWVIKYYNEASRRNYEMKLPKSFNREIVELLAIITAEGWVSEDYPYKVFITQKDYIGKFWKIKSYLESLGIRGYVRHDKRSDEYVLEISNMLFAFILREAFKLDIKDKFPYIAFDLPRELKAHFLSCLFNFDGSFSGNAIEISQKRHAIINNACMLLLSFGIVGSLNSKFNRKYKKEYHFLSLYGRKNLERFYKDIGFFDKKKQNKLKEYLKSVKSSRYTTSTDMIPYNNEFLNSVFSFIRYTSRRLKIRSNIKKQIFYKALESSRSKGRHTLSRSIYAEILDYILRKYSELYEHGAEVPKNLYLKTREMGSKLNYFWDPIEEKKEIKMEKVFDMSVLDDSHSFIGGVGGIVLHNTLIAKAVANEAGANFISVAGPELMSRWYGGSEENLRKVFDEAEKNAPSIIFIDEIDAIAPKREEVTGEVERRVVSQLLTLMDGLKGRGKVVVIAATNRPNSLDPALRRGGRFDREIEVPVPDKKGRREILQIHTRSMPMEKDVDIDKISEITYGFVGADLSTLVKEAAMHALRKIVPEISSLKHDEPIPNAILEKLKVTKEDFEYAMRVVQPSAMREVLIEIPKVKWTDVGGLEDVKEALTEAVIWQIKNPESFKRVGIRPPHGILLYGPPGTGKTHVAKALANEAGVNLIAIKGPEVLNMFVGESEKRIREIFRRAKQVAPAIILFDEIDAIAPKRGTEVGSRVSEQVVSQLLTEMSGIEDMEGVVIIASSNRPDILDPALLRPGRFDRLIYVPAPEEKTRLEILKIHTRAMPLKDVDLEKIAEKTEGYSGADLEAICREAGLNALRENPNKAKEVGKKHFEEALKRIKPSITEDMFKKYQRIMEEVKRTKLEEKEATSRYIG